MSRTTTISLQHRIVVLVLLMMTATFVFFAVWGWRAKEQTRADMVHEREVSVQLAASRIDGIVSSDLVELRDIAQSLAETPSTALQPQQALLLRSSLTRSFTGGVYMIDRAGRLVAGTEPIAGVALGAVLPQRDLLRNAGSGRPNGRQWRRSL